MRTRNGLGWGTSVVCTKSFATNTRQRKFRDAFNYELIIVKDQHGSGVYSYAEGMTRKAARRIARNRARNTES